MKIGTQRFFRSLITYLKSYDHMINHRLLWKNSVCNSSIDLYYGFDIMHKKSQNKSHTDESSYNSVTQITWQTVRLAIWFLIHYIYLMIRAYRIHYVISYIFDQIHKINHMIRDILYSFITLYTFTTSTYSLGDTTQNIFILLYHYSDEIISDIKLLEHSWFAWRVDVIVIIKKKDQQCTVNI